MNEQANIFTAGQIAEALGVRRQSLKARLAGIKPSGQVVVYGNPAAAWEFACLPETLKTELQSQASKSGYRDAIGLLNFPHNRWEPEHSLSAFIPEELAKASNLRDALADSLIRVQDPLIKGAELENQGVEDYRRIVGHAITPRHWRRLLQRTLDRDRGKNEWHRLELYLGDKPALKQQERPAPELKGAIEFDGLRQFIATFQDPTCPTEAETVLLWLSVCECYDERLGREPVKQTRRMLFGFLFKHAPFLAASMDALRVSFDRKYNRWVHEDRKMPALTDGRTKRLGKRQAVLREEDRDKLVYRAVFQCGGRISQAYRECCQQEILSEAVLGRYVQNPASKSHVPKNVRDAIKHEVAQLEDIHHGPRQTRLNGAHLTRGWSGVHTGDWYQADDITLPVYFYVEDGQGGYRLTRGQCLLFIDLRSTCVLGFSLIPEKHYNAHAIRATIARVCDEHGLPRRGFYFECGIWKSSKLLKGDVSPDVQPWPETETGLRGLGIEFIHANPGNARSKPVERVIGALQNLMEGQPGYVGRNEMVEKFEAVQRAKLDVESGRAHPSAHFMSLGEWIIKLDAICEAYNADKQDGAMTGGLSPNDAFKAFDDKGNPQTRLDARCRYLLATHRRPITVTNNGITLKFGKQSFNYRGKETGPLVGQMVLAWFNPESPDILTVTDMNRLNPFTIARSQNVPAIDATAEQFHQAMGEISDHQAHATTRYRTLKAKFGRSFRTNCVPPEVAKLGHELEKQRADLVSRQKQETAYVAKIRKIGREVGMNISTEAAQDPERLESASNLRDFLKKFAPVGNRLENMDSVL